jgi:aminoglycoside/choline kinase family phosphotransferase
VNDMPRVLGYLRRAAARYRQLDPLTALLDELHDGAARVAGS